MRVGRLPLLFMTLTGCLRDDAEGGQTGEVFPAPCDETSEVVGLDDATLGFTGRDVLAALRASTSTAREPDGTDHPLEILIVGDELPTELVRSTPRRGGPDGVVCVDRLLVPAQITLGSTDGWVDGVVAAPLGAWAVDTASTGVTVQPFDLGLDGDGSVWISASWDRGVPSGSLVRSDGSADVTLATWGEATP